VSIRVHPWPILKVHTGTLGANEADPRWITVPAGDRTDFASIPRVLWPLLPPVGRSGKAAVIHDWPCDEYPHSVDHKMAADIFNEAMAAPSEPAWRRAIMVWAVEWFGPRFRAGAFLTGNDSASGGFKGFDSGHVHSALGARQIPAALQVQPVLWGRTEERCEANSAIGRKRCFLFDQPFNPSARHIQASCQRNGAHPQRLEIQFRQDFARMRRINK